MKKLQILDGRYGEILRYLIIGGLTTFVSLGVYWICVSTFLDPHSALKLQAANVISWIAAVTFAFFTNRTYVFRSRGKNIAKEAWRFYISRLSTLAADMLIMFVLVTLMHWNDKIAKLIVQVVVTILNYLFSKFLVFRDHS